MNNASFESFIIIYIRMYIYINVAHVELNKRENRFSKQITHMYNSFKNSQRVKKHGYQREQHSMINHSMRYQ